MTIRRALMQFTDISMLIYWIVTALMAFSVFDIPAGMLFKEYDDPRVVAWNWSFFPIDIAFSLAGLLALRMEKKGTPAWQVVAAISLTLTFCAGIMAISYWAILAEFSLSWWGPNLFLMIWPLFYLPGLVKSVR